MRSCYARNVCGKAEENADQKTKGENTRAPVREVNCGKSYKSLSADGVNGKLIVLGQHY